MLRVLGWLLLCAVLGVMSLPFIALESAPLVSDDPALDPPQVARARALLAEHNPARLRDGDVKALHLSDAEANLVLDYLVDQFGDGASRVSLAEGRLTAQVSHALPASPLGRFLNLELVLSETDALPRIARLRVGRLRIPGMFANPVFDGLVGVARVAAGLPVDETLLKRVTFSPAEVALQYQWDAQLASAVRQQLVPPEDEARLHAFHLQLVGSVRERGRAMTLSELAAPLFALGVTRASSGDPVADNRAALLVLSSYVSGQRLTALVPAAENWPQASRYTVRVHGRHDLAKHFLNSAALTAAGGRAISTALGLSKEIADSRGGSGFSFVDLLADEAGTRFGQRATESRVVAREIQQRAANARRDLDWMPVPDGLREQMTEAEFERQFGGIAGDGYRRTLADIKRRIDAVAMYR
ncbi:MAG: hypothetical protein AB7O21_02495 [Gammaproteobacteria bacterium]